MKIGFLVEQSLAPVPGGTGRYSVEVASALVREAPPRGTVQPISAWHRSVAAARVPGALPVTRLPVGRRGLAALWERGLPPWPRGVDLVHAPTLLAPTATARVPVVVTVHDVVPWTHPETLTPRGARWHRTMAELAARTAAAVVVPTHAVGRELGRHVELRGEPVVVGLGASEALRPPADAAPRARDLDLPAGGYVLSLATLEPRKGLDVLLRALARPDAPDLPLLVVGPQGWGGVDPVAAAREAGVPAGRVRVLGRVPDADLAVVLAGATVLAVPSRAEGFGLPALEAMAAGVPVVTSTDPALVEVGAGAAVAVDVADEAGWASALHRVASAHGVREEMVTAGLARAAHYSWESSARRLWSLYEEVLGR